MKLKIFYAEVFIEGSTEAKELFITTYTKEHVESLLYQTYSFIKRVHIRDMGEVE